MAIHLTDLEQSKKLKEWGAPQDTAWYWWENTDKPGEAYLQVDDSILQGGQASEVHFNHRELPCCYAAYDLESLIGWLGDGFGKLWRCPWRPEIPYAASGGRPGRGYTDLLKDDGNTPLEAVYALAEAINGPKT